MFSQQSTFLDGSREKLNFLSCLRYGFISQIYYNFAKRYRNSLPFHAQHLPSNSSSWIINN